MLSQRERPRGRRGFVKHFANEHVDRRLVSAEGLDLARREKFLVAACPS
jgi:hypothetical protein